MHTDFLKHILHVRKSTPHFMLHGDLGRHPISISVNKRIIGYWHNVLCNTTKLSAKLYRLVLKDYINSYYDYKWLSNVKSILDECGLSYIWYDQSNIDNKFVLLTKIDFSFSCQYVQTWHSGVNCISKCRISECTRLNTV